MKEQGGNGGFGGTGAPTGGVSGLASLARSGDRRTTRSGKRKRLNSRPGEAHARHHRSSGADVAIGPKVSQNAASHVGSTSSTCFLSASTCSTRLQSHVCLIWTDNANIVRCRCVPRARFERGPGRFQLTLTNAVQSMPLMHDVAMGSPVGEVRLVPDLPSLVPNGSAWIEDTSLCFGFMDKDGQEWQLCPRTFLQRQENLLKEKFQCRASVGFEMEFVLLFKDSLQPIDSTLYCEVRALQSTTGWLVLKRIVEILANHLDIPVWQYHAESGSGQFEISLGPFNVPRERDRDGDRDRDRERDRERDPGRSNGTHGSGVNGHHQGYGHGQGYGHDSDMSLVHAVDKLILARQTVHHVAAQFGLVATFLPKFRPNEAGSAAHIHLGLVDHDSTNLFESQQELAAQFLAGVVHKLPSMSMLLAPTMNSYDRLLPKCWAGAFRCYGFENREAPVRLISNDNSTVLQRVQRIEIKTVDATANPYVALGAILATGMHGMDHKVPLEKPCEQDPADLPEATRPPALPRSLEQAMETFEQDREFWDKVLTESYSSLLLRLRREEHKYYSALSAAERHQELLKRF